MPLYLQVEIDSSIPPDDRWTRIVEPLDVALAEEGLGRVCNQEPVDADKDGPNRATFEVIIEVTDMERARAVVEHVLSSV